MFRGDYEKRLLQYILPIDKRRNRDIYDSTGTAKIVQLFRIIR